MKFKRFLALAVSLAMVITMIPAFSLTASAAETVVYTATATGHSGSASGGSLFVACTGTAGGGSSTRAAFINGTTGGHDTTLGSTRIGAVEFQIDGSIDPNSVESAIMSLYLKSVNGNLGTSWTLIAGYETANPTLSYATGGMNDADFAAVNNDYSNAATFWTNESCSSTTSGWKTMDISRAVKNALVANAALATPNDKVTVVIRLQVPTAGLNLGDSGSETPYLTVTTNNPDLIAVSDNLKAISLPLMTKANIELPSTVKGANDADIAVTWTSDNEAVIDGEGNYTSPENVTTVVLTPSATVGSEVVYGKEQSVVVFPASRAGSEYNSGSGVYTLGSENIIAANGTAASFEDAAGNQSLAGWTSHLGGETNGAIFWADASTEVVPDGNWAYIGQWNDNITHNTNFCTIDTMWPVEAGKYYLSFYSKKIAGGSTTYVYYSTDNAHHRNDASLTSEAWYSIVNPDSDWVKHEYVIEAPQAGYIGFTSYNIGNNNSRGTFFDDFELYTATQAAETLVGVPAVSAEVTVIAGNTPVLPATVNGTGSLGSAMEVAVTWDTTGLDFTTAGTVTVPGTVDGTDYTTSAEVTVLNATFAIDDSASKNGQPGNVVYFPVEIPDEFTMEFDMNIVRRTDVSVQMGYNGTLFSAAALGISPNGGALKVTGGSRNGSAGIGHTLVDTVNNGDTIRVLLTMDASTGTYSITVTTADGTTNTVSEQGFRQAQSAINTMTLVTNGSGSMGDTAADGDITVSNVKVSSAYADALKTEYTVVTTVNGTEESTKTVAAFSVDEITAEEREGYMLTKTVDGNTVTFAYVSTIDVTITYTLNGETIKTVTNEYDPLVSTGAEFEAVTYYKNGVNAIYEAAAATYAESQSVELTALANNGTYELGDIVVGSDGTQYEIASANLVSNGDFSLGLTGWYAADGSVASSENFTTDASTGSVYIVGNNGSSSNLSLQRSWAVESGKTYVFVYTQNQSSTDKKWQRFSLGNTFASNNACMLSGAGEGDVETGQSVVEGTNVVVFTNTDGYAYANFVAAWSGGVTLSNFGLYEVVPATVIVTEEIASVEDVADVTVFGNDTVVLPATVKVTGTLGSNVDGTVVWDVPSTYPAGATEVTGTVTAQFGAAEPVTTTVSTNVTVIDEFTLDNFTSAGNQNDGKSNQVVFPVAIRGAFTMKFTANYASFGDLFITMKTADAGFFGPEQIALGVNDKKAFRPVNGNGNGGRAADDADQAILTEGVDYGFIVTTDASADKYSVVVYDVATGVVVAEVNDFGYRTNADAIEVITALTNDGQGSVTLTNIKVDTSAVELCTVTVDGEVKTVVKGYYSQALTGAALVDAAGTIYAPVNGVVTVPVDADMVLTTKALGLTMVDGAQVRIGATELEDGAKLDAMADSGLRFLATADYNETLVAEADEFGIKVTAEGSDKDIYVPAKVFQNEDETVFSAAITNLAESNYNRKYTAVAYAKVNGVEITTDSVTRSIYQVSAGIMKNGSADAEGAEYTVDGVVKNILNAYVNQTGIRLSVTADAITVEDGKYTGDVFFTVTSVSDGDDGFNVTITPDTSWGTPAEIAEWWMDYVRFNNNNKTAKWYISDPAFADGVLTFNFDTTADPE